jgi:hypothetical protein
VKKATLVVFILLAAGTVYSQVAMSGGKGMLRLYEADNVTPGQLYINPFGTFFATKMADVNVLAKDYTINTGVTLGISRRFETFIHLVPYQTDQVHIWGPPGDAKLGLKFNIPNRGGVAQFALAAYGDIPIAQFHPLEYESYSEDAFGYALIGIASFNFKNAASHIPIKLTTNIGYKSHNASSGFFSDDTDQLIGGFGIKFPVKSSQLYTEATGEIFINNSDVPFVKNSLRFTQGYKFITRRGLIFDIAADVRIGQKPTLEEKMQLPRVFADYADWKIIVGMTYRTTLFKKWNEKFQQQEQQRKTVQKEQEEIRKMREKVVDELEEYKKRLQDKEKQEVPF